MPIGSLVLELLQHLNYPGCAATTCDLNRDRGYLGLLGLDGIKAGEGKGDRFFMIDPCLEWPAACSRSIGNSTECGEDIYTKPFRLTIASQAFNSWIESHLYLSYLSLYSSHAILKVPGLAYFII